MGPPASAATTPGSSGASPAAEPAPPRPADRANPADGAPPATPNTPPAPAATASLPEPGHGPRSGEGAPHPPTGDGPRVAIDLLAIGASAPAGGYGLTLTTQVFLLPFFALRAGGGFREGLAGSPDGFTSTTWMVGGGVAAYALRSTRARPVGAWLRVDGLFEDQGLALGNARHWTPLPALDAVADLSFLFLEDVEVVAGGGAELALTSSETIEHLGATFTLQRLRAVGEAGIRLRF